MLSEQYLLQEHHFSLLQHETEKLRHDIEKMRSELRSGLCIYPACWIRLLPIFFMLSH